MTSGGYRDGAEVGAGREGGVECMIGSQIFWGLEQMLKAICQRNEDEKRYRRSDKCFGG